MEEEERVNGDVNWTSLQLECESKSKKLSDCALWFYRSVVGFFFLDQFIMHAGDAHLCWVPEPVDALWHQCWDTTLRWVAGVHVSERLMVRRERWGGISARERKQEMHPCWKIKLVHVTFGRSLKKRPVWWQFISWKDGMHRVANGCLRTLFV